MTFGFVPLAKRIGIAAFAAVLAGTAWAQVPSRAPSQAPSRAPSQDAALSAPVKQRQPSQSSIQEQNDRQQTKTDKGGSEADRKVRETDRRLNRTLRSVCIGC
ncbi:hypothetical protein [Microvirga sp. TS319]|uniref:hypothetical protein n=1 Tax=Microvirga sp. TS319 TaxID=3241165 RepID=UPI00351A3575